MSYAQKLAFILDTMAQLSEAQGGDDTASQPTKALFALDKDTAQLLTEVPGFGFMPKPDN